MRTPQVRVNPAALKTIRELTGYSRPEFAETLGVTDEHIRMIEAGRRRPSTKLFHQMRLLLMVKASALLANPDEEIPEPDGEAVGA